MINLDDEYKLKSLVSSFSSEDDNFKKEYKFLELPINPYIELEETTSVLVSCLVTVTNKYNGESISHPLDLLEIPIRTSMGIKINGTFYEICSLNSRANGWYNLSKKGSEDILELLPVTGRILNFVCKNGIIYVKLGSSGKDINLGVYLKAISNLNYREILKFIGIRNNFIAKSLTNEPNYSECVDEVLSAIILDKNGSGGYTRIPKELRERELKKMLGPQFIKLDKSSRDRYNTNSSFLNRCLGLELSKPVLSYQIGTKLTQEILNELDNSDTNCIFVSKNSKVFEIKKYKVDSVDIDVMEIFTELNIYCNNLSGFKQYDDSFDEVNRSIIPLEESIRREISARLVAISSYLDFILVDKDIKLNSISVANLCNEPLDSFIMKCKQEFKHAQGSETTNIIAYLAKASKVTLDYSGQTNEKIISIKASQQSTYDLLHIPEGPKVGLVNHLTMRSFIGGDGVVYSPYVKVVNGLSTGEVVSLSPRDRAGKRIAPWDVILLSDKVRCYFGERVITVNPKEIDYQEYSALQTISLPVALIPFYQFSDGKRSVMGGNQNKQAVSCLRSEAPLVSTGALYLEKSSKELVVRATDILDNIYVTNNLIGKVNYDLFMTGSVSIINIDNSKIGYRGYLFECNYDNSKYLDTVVLPFCKRATDNVMFHYHLNYKLNHTYRGRDIVLYNNSIDINKSELDLNINLGHETVEDLEFDFDSALGCNYLAAFKSSGIPNMDDGICISDELLGTYKLAHVKIIEVRDELKSYREGVIESFGIRNETTTHKKDGLPKIGTWLKPRSNVIGKTIIKNGIESQVFTTLGMDSEGEVVSASIERGKAVVYVATISDVELGDKLSGDHGNKGVIGKIVPKKDMPFMKDGTPIQITLNPLGIPSRMNFSQLFVGLIGFALKLSGKRLILSSGNPDSYEVAQRYLSSEETKPVQLFDGRTSLPFDRTTSVVQIYLKKLSHNIKSKMNNCGAATSFNPVTNQPIKGKSVSGGQKMGEMETWAFEALGAKNLLQELFTIKSDDVQGRSTLSKCLESGEEFTGKLNNNNIHFLQAFLRGLCCELEVTDNSYSIRPLLDSDIRGLSISPSKGTRESLQDNNVYGDAQGPKGIDASRKRWGYIDLGCEIVHPSWIYKGVIPRLITVTKLSLTDAGEVIYRSGFMSTTSVRQLIEGKYFVDLTKNDLICSDDSTLLENPSSGISSFVSMLKMTDLYKTKSAYKKEIDKILEKGDYENNQSKSETLYKLNVLMNSINSMIDSNASMSDFIISTFPVLPKNFRLKMDGRDSNFDVYYNRILSACNNIGVIDPSKVYSRVLEFTGLDSSKKLANDAKTKNFMEFFTGKESDNSHGAIRENGESKVVDYSGRTVIVPGEVPLGTVGLPRQASYNLLRVQLKVEFRKQISVFSDTTVDIDPFIVGLEMADIYKCIQFLKGLNITIRSECISIINKCDSIVSDLLNKTALAVGRQPTLHAKGIRGLVPVMVEGNALHIHPLLCGDYNADFDGDQMWYAMAHTSQSIRELLTLCNPSNGIYSDKDGSVSLTPSQDILLGIYLATMLHENVLDASLNDKYSIDRIYYYTDSDLIQTDIIDGRLGYKDLICFTTKGNKYLSTAGRILFNSIIPDGFTEDLYENSMNLKFINPKNFKNLKYDGLVKKNSKSPSYTIVDKEGISITKKYCTYALSDVLDEFSSSITDNELLSLYDNIVTFGINSCITSGITLHLDDFKDSDANEKYSRVYQSFNDECNKFYELGLLTEEDRKSDSIKAANYCNNNVKSKIMSEYGRNDNLFIIIDSGARGNEAQVMRSVGFIGIISKSNTEQIETPINNGYKYGLQSSDMFIMASGTRHGVATVQKDTGKTGEMTRDCVYMTGGFKVIESDCGCGFKDLEVMYDEPMIKEVDLLGKSLNRNSQLYKDTINITRDGLINSDVVNYIFRHKVTDVNLVEETLVVKYKVSDLFKNMMINKLGSDLEGLSRGSIITEKTIESIESYQIKSIKARTVITCECSGGVCSRCYGILHNTGKLPPIGYAAGVIAGQSIGEPATQLTLNTINGNGSGNASASAVDLFKSLLSGNISDKFRRSIVSFADSFVYITDSGNQFILNIKGVKYKVSKSDLLVVDGEKVNSGQELTRGVLAVSDIPTSLDNFLEERMFRQLSTYYSIFKGSNVYVDPRHFEIVVKSQLGFGHILKSDDPSIAAGTVCSLSDINESISKGNNIEFYNSPLKKNEQIQAISGPITTLCHHDPAKSLARIATNKTLQTNKTSFLSDLISGSNLVDGAVQKPLPPKFIDFIKDEELLDDDSNSSVTEDIFTISEVKSAPKIDVDFSNLFGSPDSSEGFRDLFKSTEYEDPSESIENNIITPEPSNSIDPLGLDHTDLFGSLDIKNLYSEEIKASSPKSNLDTLHLDFGDNEIDLDDEDDIDIDL